MEICPSTAGSGNYSWIYGCLDCALYMQTGNWSRHGREGGGCVHILTALGTSVSSKCLLSKESPVLFNPPDVSTKGSKGRNGQIKDAGHDILYSSEHISTAAAASFVSFQQSPASLKFNLICCKPKCQALRWQLKAPLLEN